MLSIFRWLWGCWHNWEKWEHFNGCYDDNKESFPGLKRSCKKCGAYQAKIRKVETS